MPHASHRMDLLVVPRDLEHPLDSGAVEALFVRWGIDNGGRSPQVAELIEGGCQRVWLDRPGRLLLYANQSGGFRVQCPVNGDNISARFGRAYRNWKAGGERRVLCSCGAEHALEDCVFNPPAAFASWAIVFGGAEGAKLLARATADLSELIGDHRTVLRRP
jgi:hypothetical protein